MEQTDAKRTAACYPSPDEINALPEKFRLYIHDLETCCDRSGDVQTIAARIGTRCRNRWKSWKQRFVG
jgi:hypothetical protein